MRARLTALALMLVTASLVAQMPAQQTAKQTRQAQPDKTYVSASEVTAMMAKAKSDRKQDQSNFAQTLLRLAPYNISMEYRALVGPAAVHEKEAEFFYVIDGSATLMTGGKLVGETRTNADNLQGAAIDGGKTQDIAKGDFIIVPENTPHWFSKINGTLVLMSVHVPRPVPAAK